jgi:hypothetical protein
MSDEKKIDNRVEIRLDQELHVIVEQCKEVLRKNQKAIGIYRIGDGLYEIGLNGEKFSVRGPRLREVLSRYAKMVKVSVKSKYEAYDYHHVVAAILADLVDSPFPKLAGVFTHPVLLSDYTIAIDSGYYEQDSILICDAKTGFEVISVEIPDEESVIRAYALLRDVVCDFNFESNVDVVNFISLMIQSIVRLVISGPVPIYAVGSNVHAAGKTLLVYCASMIVTGRPCYPATFPNEAELHRMLTALLYSTEDFIILDNVVRADSAVLAKIATSTALSDRKIGTSQEIRINYLCSVVMTGVNIEYSREIARRTIEISIPAREFPGPPLCGFKYPDLWAHVAENRERLLSALVVLVCNWVKKGHPSGSCEPLDSFESWTGVISGILECAGIEGFNPHKKLKCIEDKEEDAFAAILAEIYKVQRSGWFRVNQVAEMLFEKELLPDHFGLPRTNSDMIKIGRFFSSVSGRTFGYFRFERHPKGDTKKGVALYRVIKLQPVEDDCG